MDFAQTNDRKVTKKAGKKVTKTRERTRLSATDQTQVIPPENERPKKMTDVMLAKIEAYCIQNNSLQEIAYLCGIRRATITDWRNKFPWFRVLMDQWSAVGRNSLTLKLQSHINNNDWRALQFALERRHPDYKKTDPNTAAFFEEVSNDGTDTDFSFM